MNRSGWQRLCSSLLVGAWLCGAGFQASGQGPAAATQVPWLDTSLSPEGRAALVLAQMTLAEKIAMLHGANGTTTTTQSNGGAGFFEGLPRLQIPAIQMADASYGVTHGRATGRYSTAMPSTLAATATWDKQLAFDYGALIGSELRAQGYNMSLGGGVNLAREPRNGRTFEYQGEDPLLAGVMVGQTIRGVQTQHVIGDIKHFAMNDQESGRNAVDITISERAMRESDLLAFEIGIEQGSPGAVMCSYNRLGGTYACENKHLLTEILKQDWGFKGFVLSDWGGTHSTGAAIDAGLDNEEPNGRHFGADLPGLVKKGEVTEAEIDEHVSRILRTEFASGVVDYPQRREVPDVEAGLAATQKTAEASMVLLKNTNRLLPLDPVRLKTIAIIGAHADVGMISGGGSAQVDPPGGNAVPPAQPDREQRAFSVTKVWYPTSPLRALQSRYPGVRFTFDPGTDPRSAAAAAKAADLAIVFGWQWEAESLDLPTLALGGNQNEVIAAALAANPRSIVVIESGGPVLMPWASNAGAIVETWYAGSRGAEALARILAGDVNPSARLPITFPLADADLPHPTIVQPPPASRALPPAPAADISTVMARQTRVLAPFPVSYDEGLKVGYKWYDAEKKPVLFPFGHGLSYTSFAYRNLRVEQSAAGLQVRFTVTNTGARAGADVAQVYVALPAAAQEPPRRLAGWEKFTLAPGASHEVSLELSAQTLSIYDEGAHAWRVVPGEYTISAGASSRELPLVEKTSLPVR